MRAMKLLFRGTAESKSPEHRKEELAGSSDSLPAMDWPGIIGKNSCKNGLSRRKMNLCSGTKTVGLRRSSMTATGTHLVSGSGFFDLKEKDPFRTEN